jgi:hypothetical protein
MQPPGYCLAVFYALTHQWALANRPWLSTRMPEVVFLSFSAQESRHES